MGNTRILALDYGSKRIGVAVSDPLRSSAQPCDTIHYKNRGELWEKLDRLQGAYEIETFVLGMPLNMNGTRGPLALQVTAFADELKSRYSAPVKFWDERLSSRVAENTIRQLGGQPGRRKDHIDRLAAVWILQGFLDRLSNSTGR